MAALHDSHRVDRLSRISYTGVHAPHRPAARSAGPIFVAVVRLALRGKSWIATIHAGEGEHHGTGIFNRVDRVERGTR